MATAAADKLIDLPPAMIEGPVSIADWAIVWPVALPLFGAAVLLMFRKQPGFQAPFSMLVLLGVLINAWVLIERIAASGPFAMTMGKWLPPFGISFTADMLGALFSGISALIVMVVLAFGQSEVEQREVRYGFHPLVLVLLAGVNGAFLTGDLFNLYVWFEVMLIASFGLFIIGGRKIQLDGAIKYGFINFLATTIFLVGVAYLYGLTGSLNMADIALLAANVDPGALVTVGALFLLAFGLKAAAFPLNGWLPASYHAPDPTISALFAGLLTKVGVYALIRILITILPEAGNSLDLTIMIIAGGALLISPLGAIAETNLRRALGFLVMGGIGAMLAGLAMADQGQNLARGAFGAAFYAVHSMLVMTGLYLVAGLVEKATGEKDTKRMGGLYEANSWLSILFLVLVFAVAGLPPFLGFWPKFTLVQTGLEAGHFWLVAFLLLNAFLTTIAGARLWAHMFWRRGREGTEDGTENSGLRPIVGRTRAWGMVPAALLVAVIFALGIYPAPLFEYGQLAAESLIHRPDSYISAVGLGGGQ